MSTWYELKIPFSPVDGEIPLKNLKGFDRRLGESLRELLGVDLVLHVPSLREITEDEARHSHG